MSGNGVEIRNKLLDLLPGEFAEMGETPEFYDAVAQHCKRLQEFFEFLKEEHAELEKKNKENGKGYFLQHSEVMKILMPGTTEKVNQVVAQSVSADVLDDLDDFSEQMPFSSGLNGEDLVACVMQQEQSRQAQEEQLAAAATNFLSTKASEPCNTGSWQYYSLRNLPITTPTVLNRGCTMSPVVSPNIENTLKDPFPMPKAKLEQIGQPDTIQNSWPIPASNSFTPIDYMFWSGYENGQFPYVPPTVDVNIQNSPLDLSQRSTLTTLQSSIPSACGVMHYGITQLTASSTYFQSKSMRQNQQVHPYANVTYNSSQSNSFTSNDNQSEASNNDMPSMHDITTAESQSQLNRINLEAEIQPFDMYLSELHRSSGSRRSYESSSGVSSLDEHDPQRLKEIEELEEIIQKVG
ncbi:unnamed protein product [Owenia fusiformis]|uniref:Uncharacterized protein n=1 Tax=Owenia fusiformis TaxID=6347 RepID=A0A8J1TDY5_OWEFU|nr:unnamed protein product [Owenia fusiformis]